MQNATATTGRRFETGDVVFGRPIFEGKIQPRRKGVVLGAWTEGDTKRVVVWWYGLGAASGDTSSLMWNDELTPAGDIFDTSARMAAKLFEGAYTYPRARFVCQLLRNHARRMESLGAKHPVK
ncbi:hypothetical protein SEA_XKCD426_56 [Streptomyces phage Xkcd426]|nr:hypothetical protein SEA_XKCD426_56 [Streptomyces phage Xkcd426]